MSVRINAMQRKPIDIDGLLPMIREEREYMAEHFPVYKRVRKAKTRFPKEPNRTIRRAADRWCQFILEGGIAPREAVNQSNIAGCDPRTWKKYKKLAFRLIGTWGQKNGLNVNALLSAITTQVYRKTASHSSLCVLPSPQEHTRSKLARVFATQMSLKWFVKRYHARKSQPPKRIAWGGYWVESPKFQPDEWWYDHDSPEKLERIAKAKAEHRRSAQKRRGKYFEEVIRPRLFASWNKLTTPDPHRYIPTPTTRITYEPVSTQERLAGIHLLLCAIKPTFSYKIPLG